MSKIIQIRRGTTAQNDNFTGMPGEITFDTDAKTLRVHDGVCLGGYALARANDIVPNTGNENNNETTNTFDINSVSDDFWEMLFARFSPKTFNIKTGNPVSVKNNAGAEYIFESDTPAQYARIALNCITAEAGYSAGDVVWDCGIGERSNPTPNVWFDSNGIHAHLIIGSANKWWVPHKTTGARTEITNANWKLTFTVWC